MAGDYSKERHYSLGEGIYRVTPRNDPEFPRGAWWDLENCLYVQDSDNPEVMRGSTRIGSTDMGGAVSGFLDYNNGTKFVACATDGKIYHYTGGDWAAESGARAASNSTASTTRWSTSMFYGATTSANLGILCNGIDNPAKYDNADVTDLANAPVDGNFPTPWQGRMWFAAGDTLTYTATQDCEGVGGVIVIARGNDGTITGLKAFANNLFIFKRSSIYRIAPTGTLTELSIVRNESNEYGCTEHNTIKEAGYEGGTSLTFLSESGIMRISQAGGYSGFTIEPVDKWVRPLISLRNKDSDGTAFAVWNGERREYYLHYPSGGGVTTPNAALVGNYARKRRPPRWTRLSLGAITMGTIFKEGNTDYLQYVGDDQGRVHQLHVATEHTLDGAQISGNMTTPYYVQGAPEAMKIYGYAFVDGESEGSYEITTRLQMLRAGLPSAQGNSTAITFATGKGGWGEGEWGVAPWGGGGSRGRRIRPRYVRRASGMGIRTEASRWYRWNGHVIASDRRGDLIEA